MPLLFLKTQGSSPGLHDVYLAMWPGSQVVYLLLLPSHAGCKESSRALFNKGKGSVSRRHCPESSRCWEQNGNCLDSLAQLSGEVPAHSYRDLPWASPCLSPLRRLLWLPDLSTLAKPTSTVPAASLKAAWGRRFPTKPRAIGRFIYLIIIFNTPPSCSPASRQLTLNNIILSCKMQWNIETISVINKS